MNPDELRRALDELAGPELPPTAQAFNAIRHRARRGRARRILVVALTVAALVTATTITVRSLDSNNDVSVSSPGGNAQAAAWQGFCRQAAAIETAAESGADNDPTLERFRSRYARLTRLAPTRSLQSALPVARPFLVAQPHLPPANVRTALRTVNTALADHCGRTVLDVFKIGYAFLIAPSRHPKVTSVELGDLVPSEVVSADGSLWMMASHGGGSNPSQCVIDKLDPLTGSTAEFSLPACGFNGIAGGGSLFFQSDTLLPGSNTHEIRVLKIDTAGGSAAVLGSVSMQVEGSSIAHTQLAYADNSLWLWGLVDGTGQINQVSPSTGQVERTITGIPPIGGTEPLMVATPGQLWLAGGPGGGAVLWRLDTRTGQVTVGPSLDSTGHGNIVWLASLSTEVFAGVFDTSGSGATGESSNVVAVNDDGTVRRSATASEFGSWAAAGDAGLWMLGPGAQCNAGQMLVNIDPGTLTATAVTTLRPPINPCAVGGFRRFAAVGTQLFVLDTDTTQRNTRLYRITP